ncbi:MAG TPA: leucine-rich repeat protein, partial [Treponemataceae bacterium]|nr:leucine-rich repeat protein [Treponemataceae bacterium]
YDGNGNTGGSVPVDTQAYSAWGTVIIQGNTGNLEKNDLIFAGWSRSVANTDYPFTAGSTLQIESSSITLYACWVPVYAYTISSGKATITKYNGSESVIDIPSMLDGYPVTAIGMDSFNGNSVLTKVTIPSGVISIGVDAFRACAALDSVTIPSTVTTIGTSAFCGCAALSSIVLPEGLTSLAGYVFENCAGLKSASLPSTLAYVPTGCFSGCSGLVSVSLPSKAWYIMDCAFSGCTSLTTITIPASVTQIRCTAFTGCIGLKDVDVNATTPPEIDVVMGDKPSMLFGDCSALEHIYVPTSNVTTYQETGRWDIYSALIVGL